MKNSHFLQQGDIISYSQHILLRIIVIPTTFPLICFTDYLDRKWSLIFSKFIKVLLESPFLIYGVSAPLRQQNCHVWPRLCSLAALHEVSKSKENFYAPEDAQGTTSL